MLQKDDHKRRLVHFNTFHAEGSDSRYLSLFMCAYLHGGHNWLFSGNGHYVSASSRRKVFGSSRAKTNFKNWIFKKT
jgi:hypothetical protein